MNCINPIYKLVEYLNTQVTSTSTDAYFFEKLQATLGVGNGYSISKRLNPDICCPDCPTDECNGGTYFLGNLSSAIMFTTQYLTDKAGKTIEERICCTNGISDYAASNQDGISKLDIYPICCNNFSKGYVDNLLLSLETWYDENNSVHSSMCNNYPYDIVLSHGIFEYSLFNGDSAINDIITAANMLPTDSFKFIFLMYILTQSLVITCSECAQTSNTINIMKLSAFINNCLDRS